MKDKLNQELEIGDYVVFNASEINTAITIGEIIKNEDGYNMIAIAGEDFDDFGNKRTYYRFQEDVLNITVQLKKDKPELFI